MAISSSAGYAGPVSASEWAILSRYRGLTYAVGGHDHLVATKGTGDRGVKLSDGTGIGHGVMDVNSGTVVNLNLDVMASAGSRWDTLALERDWSLGTSRFVILKGGSGKVISGARLRLVGTGKDHQPLWLLRVENGKTDIQEYVDLRVWQQDGGLHAADPMARGYMDGLGTDMLCKDGIRYIRVIDPTSGLPVWSEHRKTPFGPRPTIYVANRKASSRAGGRFDMVGWGTAASENVLTKTADADQFFTYQSASHGAAGTRFVTRKAGMYSIWGNATVSQNGSFKADLMWGSSSTGGGLPGSLLTPDAAVVGTSHGDVGGDAYSKIQIQDFRYLEAGAVISMGVYHDATILIESWQLWAQRVSD